MRKRDKEYFIEMTIRFRFADQEMAKGIFKSIYGTSDGESKKTEHNDAKLGKDYIHVNGKVNGHVRSDSPSKASWSIIKHCSQ